MERKIPARFHLLILLGIVTAIGVYLIVTTTLIARDGGGYIEYAQSLRSNPIQTIADSDHHPGYPYLILAVHEIKLLFREASGIWDWIYCAQTAALLLRVVATAVLYFVARLLVGDRDAFWAVLVFVLIPKPAEYGSDALSDWPHAFFVITALLVLMRAVVRKSWWLFGLTGLITGAGYLVRPECAQIIVCGVVWLGVQLFRRKPGITRPKAVLNLAMLLVGFVVLAGPYMHLKGAIFPKKQIGQLASLHECGGGFKQIEGQPDTIPAGLTTSAVTKGLAQALNEFGNVWMWFFIPALVVGNYVYFAKAPPQKEKWLIGFLILLNVALLTWLHCRSGYISKRHTLTLAMLTALHVPSGIRLISSRIRGICGRISAIPILMRRSERFWFGALFLVGVCIFSTHLLRPIRINKQGLRVAAAWLKANSAEDDVIILLDRRIGLYAERKSLVGFREPYFPRARYVVQIIKPGQTTLPYKQLRQAWSCPMDKKGKRGRVVIYSIEISAHVIRTSGLRP